MHVSCTSQQLALWLVQKGFGGITELFMLTGLHFRSLPLCLCTSCKTWATHHSHLHPQLTSVLSSINKSFWQTEDSSGIWIQNLMRQLTPLDTTYRFRRRMNRSAGLALPARSCWRLMLGSSVFLLDHRDLFYFFSPTESSLTYLSGSKL